LGDARALLWNASGAVTELHPTALGIFSQSRANSTTGVQQVGTGITFSQTENALLWNGSAASAINLQPTNLSGISQSRAFYTDGVQQVGAGLFTGFFEHALLWNSSANSAVDLHPTQLSNIAHSNALATNGGRQVGFGVVGGVEHAMMWNGTASSAVELHPTNLAGFVKSKANGTAGNEEVGTGSTTANLDNALLWTGSASSAVNLHPSQLQNILESRALGTNGAKQVGEGHTTDGFAHALLWSGTAASAIDLHPLLPAGFMASTADKIDAQGNVFGTAFDENLVVHAVKWVPVLMGDYNNNGVVDAADYVVWRKGLGPTYTEADFDTWKAHFGETSAAATGVTGLAIARDAVPEPAVATLIAATIATLLCVWRGGGHAANNLASWWNGVGADFARNSMGIDSETVRQELHSGAEHQPPGQGR
jgi:hypothetical protein